MNEIETKILEIDVESIKSELKKLGAQEVLNTRFTVEWFKPKGHKEGETPWFLRIRTDSSGKSEITWKSDRNFQGVSSLHKEINLEILDKEAAIGLFKEIGLENYAHQEKDRISFIYKNWSFDIDQYPGMPAYLEIEGESEESIQEGIELLGLQKKTATPKGERILIQEKYGLDWYNMQF